MTTEDHFDIDAMIDAVYKSRRRRYISKENNHPFKQSRSKTHDNDDFDINNLFEVVYKKEADDVKSSIQSKADSNKSRRSLSRSKGNNQQFRQRRSKTPDNVDFHIENLLESAHRKEDDVKTSIQSKDDSLKSRLSRSCAKENNLQPRESQTPEKDDFHINNLLEAAYKNETDDVKSSSQTKDDSNKLIRSDSRSKELKDRESRQSRNRTPEKNDFYVENLLEAPCKNETDDVKSSSQTKDAINKSIRSDSRSKELKDRESRQSRNRTPEKNDFYVENLLEAPCKNERDADGQSKEDSKIMKSKRSHFSSKEDNLPSKESSSEIPKKDDFHIDNLIEAAYKKESDVETRIQSKDDSIKSSLSRSSSKENNLKSRESKIRTPEKDEFDIKNLIEAAYTKGADDIKTSIQSKDGSDESRSSSKENHLQSKENRSTTPVKDEFDINSMFETVYENVINDVKSLIQSKDDPTKSGLSRSSSKENNPQPRESVSQTPEKDEFDINSKTPDNDEFDIDALLEAPYKNETNDDKSLSQTKDYYLKLRQSETRPKENHEDSMQTICQIPARKRRFMEEIKQRSRSVTTDESQRRSQNPEESRKRYLPSRSMSPDCTREAIHYSSDELTMLSLPTEFGKKQTNQKASYEERDARTVFLMQLPRNISTRDMKEFFSTVGQVRNFRMVSDRNSRKSKGIGYVEFTDSSAVTPALSLSGQRLYGVPILVLPTMAEKNRLAAKQAAIGAKGAKGPLKLYVGSLDYNITESMLRAIFEPFGAIQTVEIQYDPETNQSRGYGFVTFFDSTAAKRAMMQMDGFEVAGRPMKVNATYYDKLDGSSTILDDDREEKGGIEMNAQSRAYLMQKLAQTYSADINIPSTPVVPAVLQTPLQQMGKSTCLVLSNLFDPSKETDPEWDIDYRDDVLEEVTKLGMIVHIAVDKFSHEGNVYLKCLTSDIAAKVIKSFDGRWYAGRTIRAVPIPFPNYSAMFPVSANAVRPIKLGER